MADVQDLELESERSAVSLTQQPVRKNISLKLKPKVEGKTKKKDKKKSDRKASSEGDKESKKRKNSGDVPSQTTKPGGEILWNQQISLIGQKVQDPLLHQCERCSLPILLYGRMSPCKHTFCLGCAEKANGKCPRCGDIVQRIEPARLGRVFVCSFGGSRYGISGCRRSYLSQRDLHAHIKRRHQSELPVGGGDLSAEYAADLKRNMTPAVVYPVTQMQMIRETLPPPPQQVQHEPRPFLPQATMVPERPMQVPSMAMDVYRSRPPAVANFPMNQGVVQRMPPITSVTPRMMAPSEQAAHMRPRFIEDLSRQPRPVGQPQSMRFPGREELRPGWIPNERDWGHNVQRGDWMPPRSEPAPIQHTIRPPEGPRFARGAPPFY